MIVDGKWVVFRSERMRGQAMAVHEETGVIVQVTESSYAGMLARFEPVGMVQSAMEGQRARSRRVASLSP